MPGQGAGTPQASGPRNQSTEQRQCCSKFNEDFENGAHQKKKILKKKKEGFLEAEANAGP